MSVTLQDFPDVDEAEIASIATSFATGSDKLDTARDDVGRVGDSGSWTSPEARPAYDDAIRARRTDLKVGREALDHVAKVLDLAAREVETSRAQYEQAKFTATFVIGDPYLTSPKPGGGDLEDLLNPDTPTPDPEQVRRWNAEIRRANQAAEDAEYALAICANELLGVSSDLSFPEAPPYYSTPDGQQPTTKVIFPISPAWGAPQGAVYAGGAPPPQFKTGRAFEANILRQLGISGDRKALFRPDAKGNYNLPRTKSGLLYRGTFPDSLRAGVLEIKSGTTQIKANSPQIRVMQWVARTTGTKFNLIVAQETPVERALLRSVQRNGGLVLRQVAGAPPGVFYDEASRRLVRATGGQGPRGEDLKRTPLSAEETRQLSQSARDAVNRLKAASAGAGTPKSSPVGPVAPRPGAGAGPSAPYVPASRHAKAWQNVPRAPSIRGGRGGGFRLPGGGFRFPW